MKNKKTAKEIVYSKKNFERAIELLREHKNNICCGCGHKYENGKSDLWLIKDEYVISEIDKFLKQVENDKRRRNCLKNGK